MNFLRCPLFLGLVFLGFFSAEAQYTDIINSNRPSESFSAFSVGATIFQVEGGVSYLREQQKDKDARVRGFLTDLDIRYGFWKEQLEFIGELQYQNDSYKIPQVYYENRSFMTRTSIGFKYMFFDPSRHIEDKHSIYSWKENHRFKWKHLIPAMAIYAGANFNFSDNPYLPNTHTDISPKIALGLQNQFNRGWVVITNLIANNFTEEYRTYEGILTATKSFNWHWSGFAEIQGIKGDLYNDIYLRGGAAYLFDDNIQFDVSVGKNFNRSRDVMYIGLGASWRFTLNYRDLMLYKTLEAKPDDFKGMDPEKELNPEEVQDPNTPEEPQTEDTELINQPDSVHPSDEDPKQNNSDQ